MDDLKVFAEQHDFPLSAMLFDRLAQGMTMSEAIDDLVESVVFTIEGRAMTDEARMMDDDCSHVPDAMTGVNRVADAVHAVGLPSYLEDMVLALGGEVPDGGFPDQCDALRCYVDLAFPDERTRAYYIRTAFPGWLPEHETALPTDAEILADGRCLLCDGTGVQRTEVWDFSCAWCDGSGAAADMMAGFRGGEAEGGKLLPD